MCNITPVHKTIFSNSCFREIYFDISLLLKNKSSFIKHKHAVKMKNSIKVNNVHDYVFTRCRFGVIRI